MKGTRSFLALELDDACREKLSGIQTRLREHGIRVHWEPSEKLHVTVRFLGSVDPEILQSLGETLSEKCRHLSPFDIVFTSLGAFPSLERPRVLWAGAHQTSALMNVFTITESVCRDAGLKSETRAHHPHCSVGRVKSGDDVASLTGAAKSITFDPILTRSSSLSIMKSVLHQGGSSYTRLSSIPFSRTRSFHD